MNKEKLITLNSKESTRYFEALGLVTDVEHIQVDARGFSPQIAQSMGNDYLGDRYILVSPYQRYASNSNPRVSGLDAIVTMINESPLTQEVVTNAALTNSVQLAVRKHEGDDVVYYNLEELFVVFDSQKKLNSPPVRFKLADIQRLGVTGAPLSVLVSHIETKDKYIRMIKKLSQKIDKMDYTYLDLEEISIIKKEVNQFQKEGFTFPFVNSKTPQIVTLSNLGEMVYEFQNENYTAYIHTGTKNQKSSPFIVYEGPNIGIEHPIDIYHISEHETIANRLLDSGYAEYDYHMLEREHNIVEEAGIQVYANWAVTQFAKNPPLDKITLRMKDYMERATQKNMQRNPNDDAWILRRLITETDFLDSPNGKRWDYMRCLLDPVGMQEDFPNYPYLEEKNIPSSFKLRYLKSNYQSVLGLLNKLRENNE